MTFTDSPQKLWDAIQADIDKRQARLEKYDQLIDAYEGGDGAPSNHTYEYATLVAPQIVFRNPRVNVSSRVPGVMTSLKTGMRYAIESEQQRQKVCEMWEQVVVESFFLEGITHVTVGDDRTRSFADNEYLVTFGQKEDGEGLERREYGPDNDGDSDDRPTAPRPGKHGRRPIASRIDPKDFVMDSSRLGARHARRMGHRYYLTRNQLLDKAKTDDTWDVEAITQAAAYTREERTGESAIDDGDDEMLAIWCIWTPGYYPDTPHGRAASDDPRYNGSLHYLSEGANGGLQLRKTKPYFGPARGPYQLWQGHPIPSKSERLAPLMATDNQRKAHAASGRSLLKAIKSFKRVVAAATPAIARKILGVGNDHVVGLGVSPEKLPGAVKELTWGGLSSEQLAGHQFLTDQKDQTSGINDNKRGQLSNSTATEATIANQAGELRIAMHRESCHRAAGEMLEAMAWYIWMDPKVLIPLPFEAIKDLGVEEDQVDPARGLLYEGGDGVRLGKRGTVFEDLAVSIEPYSMERTNEGLQMKRVMEMFGIYERTAQLYMNTQGGIDAPGLLDYIGAQLNSEGVGKFFHLGQPDNPEQPPANNAGAPQPAEPTNGTALPGRPAGAAVAQENGV